MEQVPAPTRAPANQSNLNGTAQNPEMSWRHHLFLLRRAAASARYARKIPPIPLDRAFPTIDEVDISMRHQSEKRGLPHGEAYVLSLVTAYLQPRRIFEIGTGTGWATVLMARQAPEAQIDTLDLGPTSASLGEQRGDAPLEVDAVGQCHRDSPYSRAVVQHLGDSATFDFEPFSDQIDLVFVDGAHTYEYVKQDSRTALSMIRPGGVILWDDCHLYHPEVSAALLELRRDGVPVERIGGTRFALVKADA